MSVASSSKKFFYRSKIFVAVIARAMDCAPRNNSSYSTQEYWEERYKDISTSKSECITYDWFRASGEIFSVMKPFLDEICRDCSPQSPSPKVLVLGCGNSVFFKNLYDEGGYINIVNVDYSQNVISHMKTCFQQGYPSVSWVQADIRNMKDVLNEHHNGTFPIIIDKGTLDVFLCGSNEDVWSPSNQARSDVSRELDEVDRLLGNGNSTFFYITFGQPHFRIPLLERPSSWSIQKVEFGSGIPYFLYMMRRASTDKL